ncbi:MAG: DUF4349 domain-containing protein [Lachnospiraceae bacterium]|nr:DUF4349 domain-containing protein [Lachnospiraceae bacterium]
MKKKICLIMGLAVLVLCSGCGSSKNAYVSEAYDSASSPMEAYNASWEFSLKSEALEDIVTTSSDFSGYGGEMSEAPKKGDEQTELYNAESEKLIRTVTMRLQTKEFDALLAYLDSKAAEFGGYIQNSQIYGNEMDYSGYRSASLTFRIPQKHLDAFVSGIGENATVVRRTENTENITLKYADTESRLKALQIEQERFLELLEKADNIDAIIALEEHLTELRYQIESYASTLKIYDNQVSYSTVTLDISEVKRTTPVEQNPTVFTRMKEGFKNTLYEVQEGMADFVVWFVTNFLYLLFWGAVLAVVFVIARKQISKRKRKKAAVNAAELQQDAGKQNDGLDFKK